MKFGRAPTTKQTQAGTVGSYARRTCLYRTAAVTHKRTLVVCDRMESSATTHPILAIQGLERRFGDRIVLSDFSLTACGGRQGRDRRAERGGQDDAAPLHRGHGRGRRAGRSASQAMTPARSRPGGRSASRSRRSARSTCASRAPRTCGCSRGSTGSHGAPPGHGSTSSSTELELTEIAAQRCDRCSSGQLQQLSLARALLGEPALLLLDEPTRSLDADARERFWGALERRPHACVICATHVQADLDRLARARVARQGRRSDRVGRQRARAPGLRAPAVVPARRSAFDLAWGVIDLLLYYFISDIVDPTADELGAAPSYFAFATAGIVMSLVVYATSTEVAYRVRDEQLTGTLEMLCAQPLRPVELALGVTAFPLVFAVARVGRLPRDRRPRARPRRARCRLGRGDRDARSPAGWPSPRLGILAAAATIVFKRADVDRDARSCSR